MRELRLCKVFLSHVLNFLLLPVRVPELVYPSLLLLHHHPHLVKLLLLRYVWRLTTLHLGLVLQQPPAKELR